MFSYTICTALFRLCEVRWRDQGPEGCLTEVDTLVHWSFGSACIGGSGGIFFLWFRYVFS